MQESLVNGILDESDSYIKNREISKKILKLTKTVYEAPRNLIKSQVKQKKIDKSAADYVEQHTRELSIRERNLKFQAVLWYTIGFVSLLGGISVAIYFISTTNKDIVELTTVLFLIFKSLFLIGLFIAASRYSFNLGKTYMNESLKNADRIHAISFGKFYLQVFSEDINSEDLKDVFKDWNTNHESSFMKLDSNEFDPKMLELFLKFAETIKGKKRNNLP